VNDELQPRMDPSSPECRALLDAARETARRSVAPPAERTGAVALTRGGERFPGATVRLPTAAGLSVCAEQVALWAAHAATEDPVELLVVWLPAAAGDHPCGQCLQIWLELARDARLLMQRGDEAPRILSLAALMPDAFLHFKRGA